MMTRLLRSFSVATLAAALLAGAVAIAAAQQTVVVPTRVIYPGETLGADALEDVPFTNRPELLANVAVAQGEAQGKVAKRTLLPGRMIPVASLREPYAVEAGKPVQAVFSHGALVISLTAVPLQPGSVGEVIRARNIDSGVIFTGVVLADGTIRVSAT
ncbi:MAG TPA: flagellar basal body P-ring formation chaperone FlgA [Rhizobiaceae bacterium]|nr:flagellar basal body P-ring formation chaperone FlgA [Rhizobiaceae bacterium]